MAEELVPIASFSRPVDAELAKSKLDAGGVRSFVEGGTIARINPVLMGGGETKLLVRAADQVRSLAILEEDPTDAHAALREVFTDLDHDGCPRCGSTEVQPQGYSTWTFVIALVLVGLLLRVPMPLFVLAVPFIFIRRRRFRCSECEQRWWGR